MISEGTISRRSIHFRIYYFSLCLFVISLPSSRYFLSISLFLMAANWLAEANFREKFRKFTSNKAALAFTLLYVLNLVGLLWSLDLKFAIYNDLLHKLPTLVLPLLIVTSPVPDIKRVRVLQLLFISSVVAVSLIGLTLRILQPNISFREASPFMPGVYYGMMLIIAAFQLPILIREITGNRVLLQIGLTISLWLIGFLFYLRAMSGIASFALVFLYLALVLIKGQKNLMVKLSLALAVIILLFLALWPLKDIYRETHTEIGTDFSKMDKYSEQGSSYTFDTTNILRENGHLVYIYIADKELRDAWGTRSEMDYYGSDMANQQLNYTLYRYLSSKGLRKDKQGLMSLTDKDIEAVERGVTNHLNLGRAGVYIRAYEEFMGLYIYRKSSYSDPAWASFSQRLDQWRASLKAFEKRPLFGWGTGSIRHAVNYGFKENSSLLVDKNMKPHNQYLYLLLSLGASGFISFVLLYSYTIVKTGAYKILMFKIFIIVFAVNFLANNSLEEQMGQNLFVFFTLFYCFIYPGTAGEKINS